MLRDLYNRIVTLKFGIRMLSHVKNPDIDMMNKS